MSVAGVIKEHDMRTRGQEHGRRGFFHDYEAQNIATSNAAEWIIKIKMLVILGTSQDNERATLCATPLDTEKGSIPV